MIENLRKYYNIDVNEYEQYINGIVFLVSGIHYYFIKSILDEESVKDIYIKLNNQKYNRLRLHEFVLNKDGNVYSNGYVLFKVNVLIYDIDLNDILVFNSYSGYSDEYLRMDELWYSKIDYLEYQIEELSYSKLINNSFDYFVGLGELLLSFYRNNYVENVNNMCLAHRELKTTSSLEFYNPLNIVNGNKYKDVVSFIRLTNDWNLLESLVDSASANDKNYIFVRMCFPFEYFYITSRIVLKEIEENELIIYLNKINDYERYLADIEDIMNIKLFFWLKKSN